MTNLDLLYGFLIGIASCFVGSCLVILILTDFTIIAGFEIMRTKGALDKLFSLGAIVNVAAFFVLLKFQRDKMAKGVFIATAALLLLTLLL